MVCHCFCNKCLWIKRLLLLSRRLHCRILLLLIVAIILIRIVVSIWLCVNILLLLLILRVWLLLVLLSVVWVNRHIIEVGLILVLICLIHLLLLLILKLVKEVYLGISSRIVVVVVLLLRHLRLLVLLLVRVESSVSWLDKWLLLGCLHHLSACWWAGRQLWTGREILRDLLLKGLSHTRDEVLWECIGTMVVMIDVGTNWGSIGSRFSPHNLDG